jgi:hypothetical protein
MTGRCGLDLYGSGQESALVKTAMNLGINIK